MKKVIIKRGSRLLDVAPVIRETKTLVIAGHNGSEQYRLNKPTQRKRDDRGYVLREHEVLDYPYPSDKEIAEAEKELADRKREKAAEERARQKRIAKAKADPRYELLRRFGNGADFEPWRKLTLEELQTIADIFDRASSRHTI